MRLRELMLHLDYRALRKSRSDADENSHQPKASLYTLRCVNTAELPPDSDLMLEKPLPPNLVVPEPLILKYFPTFMRDLPLEHRYGFKTRYDYALRMELVRRLAGALVVEHWWTERFSLIAVTTSTFLPPAHLEAFPGII